jgi:hypothetical protein
MSAAKEGKAKNGADFAFQVRQALMLKLISGEIRVPEVERLVPTERRRETYEGR